MTNGSAVSAFSSQRPVLGRTCAALEERGLKPPMSREGTMATRMVSAHRLHNPVLYQLSYAHQKGGESNTRRRVAGGLESTLRMLADPVRRRMARTG